jgi:hypothetical protein
MLEVYGQLLVVTVAVLVLHPALYSSYCPHWQLVGEGTMVCFVAG